jgi:hypothetical protein
MRKRGDFAEPGVRGCVINRFMPLHPKPMSRVLFGSFLLAGALAVSPLAQAAPESPGGAKKKIRSAESQGFEPNASQLRRLRTAAEVELWLAREVPEGFSIAEAPGFFEAADEVFFNAEENLFVYAYRSAETGRWIAWVAFDADRSGVVHTAAINLDR